MPGNYFTTKKLKQIMKQNVKLEQEEKQTRYQKKAKEK